MTIAADYELVSDTKSIIAESPSWDAKNDCLYWVDIIGKKVFRYYPKTKKTDIFTVDKYVSYVVPREKGGAMIGMQDGFYNYNFDNRSYERLAQPKGYNELNYRFNDGKVDPSGRLWAGTTTFYEERHDCSLYRLDVNQQIFVARNDVKVSNGLEWSPDHKKFYYIDSAEKIIFVYDYEEESGNLSNQQVLLDFNTEGANPDGMTVDVEGMLWIAHWGGHQISRWNPKSGKKIESISFPVKRVTSMIFGGDDLSDLYVTTASFEASAEQLKKEPLSGDVFKINLGISGVPTFAYKG